MDLDIRSAVITAYVLLALGALFLLCTGIQTIKRGQKVPFYRIRSQRVATGWRSISIGIILGFFSILLFSRGETTAYRYFPPSPTISRTPTITFTPTITLIPSITLTPTITLTPVISDTPTDLPTPFIPDEIATNFISKVTPFTGAIISPLEFSQQIVDGRAFNPATLIYNPVGHLYAVFSYDQMVPNVQYTAIWYRGIDIVHYESYPWDGSTGGFYFTDWDPDPSAWIPGDYRVAIFVGMEFKVSGEFTVLGNAPTAVPTASATITPSATQTLWPSYTPTPSYTSSPTRTPTSTRTPRPTDTRWPTPTK